MMQPNCQTYFLSGVVDNLLIDKQISKKKYMAAYMVMAKKEWQKLYRNTIWEVQSKWMTLQAGDPYNFVYVPEGVSRLLSVSVEDEFGNIQPLFYNPQINIQKKPSEKKCGCTADCDCGGVCEAANSMTYTTKLLFTINGVEYYEKTWTELCSNGDVIMWTETPTKKYDNTTGDGGSYNDDYNDDYDIAPAPLSNYTIVTVKTQKKVCKLETLECGCPKDTEENEELLTDTCGCNINWNCSLKRKCRKVYFENIDNNYFGEIKLSDCGNKIYYRPSPKWKYEVGTKTPDFLLVSFQSNGLPNGDVLVPDYCIDALEAGIYFRSIRFNTAIPNSVKEDAKAQYNDECAKLVGFLNPVSLIEVGKIQDISIKW